MVVAHNPGLANPEISKIIGEKWRALSEDDKNKWRSLAEVSHKVLNMIALLTTIAARKSSPPTAIS